MRYSPKLKRVMAQIETILKQNDLAGFVCLAEPGFSEYQHFLSPSFSAASLDGDRLRINIKGLALPPSQKRQMLETTSNMLALLSTTMMEQGYGLANISEHFDKIVGAQQTEGANFCSGAVFM